MLNLCPSAVGRRVESGLGQQQLVGFRWGHWQPDSERAGWHPCQHLAGTRGMKDRLGAGRFASDDHHRWYRSR
jgi:hypothetical protein